MPCEPFKLPDGTGGIICSRGARTAKPCFHCRRASSFLCDFPVTRNGRRTTCSLPLCRSCTTKLPGDVDLCKPHAAQWDHARGVPLIGPGADVELPDYPGDEP